MHIHTHTYIHYKGFRVCGHVTCEQYEPSTVENNSTNMF